MKILINYLPLNVVILIAGTIAATIIGAIIGALFAVIWNQLEEKK